jgi:hypothetical protein
MQAPHLETIRNKKKHTLALIENQWQDMAQEGRHQEMEIAHLQGMIEQERKADQQDRELQSLLKEIEGLESQ